MAGREDDGNGLLLWAPAGAGGWLFNMPDSRTLDRTPLPEWTATGLPPRDRDPGLAGIDTVDWDLDVVVGPDRRWRWKDEDELVARLK